MELAGHLGKSIAEIRALEYRELMTWAARAVDSPIGDIRKDFRAGLVASVINNRLRGRRERAKAPKDFMPFVVTRKITDARTIEGYFKALAESLG